MIGKPTIGKARNKSKAIQRFVDTQPEACHISRKIKKLHPKWISYDKIDLKNKLVMRKRENRLKSMFGKKAQPSED